MARLVPRPFRARVLLPCAVALSCGDDGNETPSTTETSASTCADTCGGDVPPDATGNDDGNDDDHDAGVEILTFTATPSEVPMGLPTQVTWEWTLEDEATYTSCSIDGIDVSSSGTTTSVTLQTDTTFRLSCYTEFGDGGDDSAETTISVGIPIIEPDHLPPSGTWEGAGVEGGIPERRAICADVTEAPYSADSTGAASAVAAIQAAIDACPEGQVVFVPEGMYLIDAPLALRTPITLRGAGADTQFLVSADTAIHMGGLGPWPPPKANPAYSMPITGTTARGSNEVYVADTSAIEVGKMIMVDEEDDPELVWTKGDVPGRYRASMHMVEEKSETSVKIRPLLPIDYTRSPQLSWFPDLTHDAGIEGINFVGTGTSPGVFIEIFSAWNSWVLDCEFSNMPEKTILAAWSGHIELRRNYMHDQANGGSNSEGLDLLADVNWSLIIDNICVAAGFPQINIGDGGANPYYSGGFGNVIAYNYCVDAYYTDPPDSPDAGKMPSDISTNHSPHSQYNLIEGNVVGKFGSDSYHGSGSHTVLLRNVATGASSWTGVSNGTAVQIDRRNLYYSLVGNVFGLAGAPATFEYATESGWSGNALYRLGFPDIGNDGYSGTHPPMELLHGDGGPRDLYVDRNDTRVGTTLVEGNWTSTGDQQDWTINPQPIPDSYFLSSKPEWFGSLPWPPVDPAAPVTDDPTIIPAGYRYVNGTDPPP